jgi:hypothetical protein
VRQRLRHIQPARQRTVDGVHHERDPEPAEHRLPMPAHGLHHRHEGEAGTQRSEDVHRKRTRADQHRRRFRICLPPSHRI